MLWAFLDAGLGVALITLGVGALHADDLTRPEGVAACGIILAGCGLVHQAMQIVKELA